jgi:hypothetical protein
LIEEIPHVSCAFAISHNPELLSHEVLKY